MTRKVIKKSTAKPKPAAKKAVIKRPKSKVGKSSVPASKAKFDGLSGRPSPVKRQINKAVKAAKKEGELAAKKKLLKSRKSQMDKILKSGKDKINRLLKSTNARITNILKGSSKRKTPVKPQRPVESPFDHRRFSGRRKKETSEQKLKRLSDHIHSVRDYILYGIACGKYKFKWAAIAKEAGYSTGERRKMLSILDNKGYSIKTLAKYIWEDAENSIRRGKTDHDIRNEIIDVLQTVNSRSDALNQLDRGQTKTPF